VSTHPSNGFVVNFAGANANHGEHEASLDGIRPLDEMPLTAA
jgi:hypothetical protein